MTVLLADDIDLSRGDLLAAAGRPAARHERARDDAVLAGRQAAAPGARLLLKHGTRTTQVIVGAITELLDPETLTFGDPPDQLQVNDIAHVGLRTADPLPVDDYAASGPPAASCSSTRRPATRWPPGWSASRWPTPCGRGSLPNTAAAI